MHVDPVAARRLLSGAPVVHGIHTLLHALEVWQNTDLRKPAALVCSFVNAVNVGDRVEYTQSDDEANRSLISAKVDGVTCATIAIEFNVEPTARPLKPADGSSVVWPDNHRAPLEPVPASQVGALIGLKWENEELTSKFPRTTERFGKAFVVALARSSSMVGMVCPGLHSVYSSLRISSITGTGDESWFEVMKFDQRFGMYVIRIHGSVLGEIKAFLRPAPQVQPSIAKVATVVADDEFAGTRSLVVGGSRGLGEVAAKILVAGGGDVVITYAAGHDDALRVEAELNSYRAGSCTSMPMDLRVVDFAAFGLKAVQFDIVCYFATPRIFKRRGNSFDVAAFNEFVSFYVTKFHELCLWGEAGERTERMRILLPSTVFIDERPKGMTEYTMAKAAAEVLATDLNGVLKHVRIMSPRLPRVLTDQTASLLKFQTESALDTLLPHLRELRS
jgi:NAD(P)-dependent dehydrogenase (short-subunit alcohol dehydrogenase family)